ncbi:MAG: lysine transporter LysE [Peptococcaceae bacterium BRH_c4b]|nr:MAG: lysine transporter LysE [Peptococcaceae bacterium BRH_c4b]
MDLTALFTTALIVGFSGAMMPGPLLTFTIAETAKRGFVAGPLIILGHAILELALVLGLAFGLAAVFTMAGVTNAIGIVGGLFLIYLGWGMSRDAYLGRVSLDDALNNKAAQKDNGGNDGANDTCPQADKKVAAGGIHPVPGGILLSLSNPYWSLWWATVGLEFINRSMKFGLPGLTSFFGGHIMADLIWYSLIAGAVAGGRRFLSQNLYKGILVFSGLFLIGLGGYFIYDAVI